MSGIAGMYGLSGQTADHKLIVRMTDVVAHRGPDGAAHWINGSIALGHRMLRTTPESIGEQQPWCDETGALCLVLDGRVDNREELKSALAARDMHLRFDTDAEIVLRAYQCWGYACPKQIIGDFAFALWDGYEQQLFCVRDILGMKPFYYHMDGRTFRFGSELQQIFVDPSVQRRPNEGMIGEYLASAIVDQEETLYRSVYRLPAAHFLIVGRGVFRKERYWDIDLEREIHYRTDAEYAEHFFALFKEAVRCRARSLGPVAAELSGGVDSSSVVGMLQSLYRSGEVHDTGFETFSLVFPGKDCDEGAYIRAVVDFWHLKSNLIQPQLPEKSWYVEQVRRYEDIPEYPNGTVSDCVKSHVRQKGFRVLLTGFGGDECLTGSYYHYADLLQKLDLKGFYRQLRDDSHLEKTIFFPPFRTFKLGILPLIPYSLRSAGKKLIRYGHHHRSWLDNRFKQKIALVQRLELDLDTRNFQSFAQKHLYHIINNGWAKHSAEMDERCASLYGIEQRHPLRDRRIIEFGLAIPEAQRWRGSSTKFVLRQAMQRFLPEIVFQRLTKADLSHTFMDAFQVLGSDRLFSPLIISSLGWVNRTKIQQMYRDMVKHYTQNSDQYSEYTWPLWNVLGIDIWFRTIFLREHVQF